MTSRASRDPAEPAHDGGRGPLDATLRTTLRAVAACGAALALGALLLLGPSAALSAAIGAALAAGNLWALARIVAALLPSPAPSPAPSPTPEDGVRRSRGAGAWTLVALVKMLALFSVVWLLMRYRAVSPLSMLLGFAALPLGIAIGSIVSDRSVRGER